LADVNERRACLYALQDRVAARVASLIANAMNGDYGHRARGGLGVASLGRDTLHAFGVLNVLPATRMHS
jgi:hypothetical protein